MPPCFGPGNPVSLLAMVLLVLALLQSAPVPEVTKTGTIRNPRLRESSGVAVSRTHRGVLWSHNDSGDGPYLYATDLAGSDRGILRVPGVDPVDWEDIALAPCPTRPGSCLYIGDTGDNLQRRRWVALYAVPEPDPPECLTDTPRATEAPAMLRLRYPDGPQDVEAIYFSFRDSSVYLVTKGNTGSIRLYRVGRPLWRSDTVVTAQRVQMLPIDPSRRQGHRVTGAAMSPDGRQVALRTLSEIYLFTPGPLGRLVPAARPRCDLTGLQAQGEAIDFLDDSTLVVTSERSSGKRGSIYTVRCPT